MWLLSRACIIEIIVLFFFFFFQAEDGIRAGHVTGVQTCALPICPRAQQVQQGPRAQQARHEPGTWSPPRRRESTGCMVPYRIPTDAQNEIRMGPERGQNGKGIRSTSASPRSTARARRSEERRVGNGERR